MAEFKKVITNKGQELITAAAFDSGELAVKYIVIGDANGESYEPSAEQTALVNQRNKLLITERIVNSPTRYTFLVQIPQDIDYYIIREIGLVDENDNLIEIAQMEQETYIQSDNLVQQLTIGIQIDVGQSSTVIVLADTNIETASKDFVNNNFQNLNQKGQANGYCGLDGLGKIPQANIPDLFANKDLSNLSAIGQHVIDGQWVKSNLTLADHVNITTTTPIEIDLSNYLPNDNYNYLIMLSVYMATGTTTAKSYIGCVVNNSLVSNTYLGECINYGTGVANQGRAAGYGYIPIGTDRKLNLQTITLNGFTIDGYVTLRAKGYRRIGTNN